MPYGTSAIILNLEAAYSFLEEASQSIAEAQGEPWPQAAEATRAVEEV